MRKDLFVWILTIALLVPSLAFGQAVKISPAERKMANEITASQLSSYLHFVASDAMGGRDTPSQGLDITAEFLKMNLERWGFKPAGDNGTFFQKFAIKPRNAAADSPPKWTQNVVAIWQGSDPILKNQMVAIGAHYDHVGTNPNAPGDDKIWNGADDDGSGTVAVLSIAEALAKAKTRPKRSILFVWHAGEEKGLRGAEHFNKFPTVDIKNVVAQLNIDMIGRSQDANNIIPCDRPRKPCNQDLSKANEIYVIGSEMMSSTLGAITKGTNDAYLKMDYNYKYDDPKDPNKFFFRSDHYHYAVNGIPIAFWFDGVHEDYHQPGDSPDKIDYAKMEKVTRTIFLTMLELADLKTRPAIDKKLPAELSAR